MTETLTVYSNTPESMVQQQKLKATFSDDQGRTLYMDYNGPEHLFRIRSGAIQRLFFFDELFQKLILRNEYGVIIGQLSTGRAGGWVRVDEKRYRFAISDKDGKVSLAHPNSGDVLTCVVMDEILAGTRKMQGGQNLMHCLIFAFAWTLG